MGGAVGLEPKDDRFCADCHQGGQTRSFVVATSTIEVVELDVVHATGPVRKCKPEDYLTAFTNFALLPLDKKPRPGR
jgi:hypothetical protein